MRMCQRDHASRHCSAGLYHPPCEREATCVDILSALLVELVVIAILFEIARRLGVPYPSLFVLGGLGLGFVPGLPHITLNPDLVLLVFLPPLLFAAAFDTPLRDLRRNLAPVVRLSIGLVVFTTLAVAAVAQAIVPTM